MLWNHLGHQNLMTMRVNPSTFVLFGSKTRKVNPIMLGPPTPQKKQMWGVTQNTIAETYNSKFKANPLSPDTHVLLDAIRSMCTSIHRGQGLGYVAQR